MLCKGTVGATILGGYGNLIWGSHGSWLRGPEMERSPMHGAPPSLPPQAQGHLDSLTFPFKTIREFEAAQGPSAA